MKITCVPGEGSGIDLCGARHVGWRETQRLAGCSGAARAEWAYERLYRDSNERSQALHAWLSYYNFHRHHGSLNRKTPAARLNELNNVLGNYN